MKFNIQPETKADNAEIKALMALSFDAQESKKRTVYHFRKTALPIKQTGYVARTACADDQTGSLLGSIRFWPVLIESKIKSPMMLPLLGPLAVNPNLRGKGIGRALVKAGLRNIQNLGFKGVLIVGDPGYYVPQGFTVEAVENLILPGPVSPLTFMGYEFQSDYLRQLAGEISPYL